MAWHSAIVQRCKILINHVFITGYCHLNESIQQTIAVQQFNCRQSSIYSIHSENWWHVSGKSLDCSCVGCTRTGVVNIICLRL